MIDIHSHLLPGVDDGPRDWDASVALCKKVAEDGVRVSIATPHLIDGVYDNVVKRLEPLVRELNERLAEAQVPLTVLLGAEVDFSSRHVTERTDELPLLGGKCAVLLEMPVAVIPPAISETIFTLRSRGLTPVIAHPERNELVQDRPSLVRPWIDAGALLQLDAESLLGIWGQHTKRCAEHLLRRGLVHAMATDAHSVDKRPPRIAAALERAAAIAGDDVGKLVNEGPAAILAGTPVQTPLYRVDTETVERAAGPERRNGRGLFSRLFQRRSDHL